MWTPLDSTRVAKGAGALGETAPNLILRKIRREENCVVLRIELELRLWVNNTVSADARRRGVSK